ncbi:CidA/LrgA family protein [Granulosicoccaceae sp. 1_MG-2023]|nr:CidA/LrgA family protein [Granulosicoccaceae sp. 1_MG-2023]
MKFLEGMAFLLAFQLVGEVVSRLFHLPVPGPVLGMILLFVFLLLFRKVPVALSSAVEPLLNNLSLLFVPAGAGVILHLKRIGSEWFPLVTSLFLSTLFGMAVTALLMHWVLKWQHRRGRV